MKGTKAKEPRPMAVFETYPETGKIVATFISDTNEIQRELMAKIVFQHAQIKYKNSIIERLKSKLAGKVVMIPRVNFNCPN